MAIDFNLDRDNHGRRACRDASIIIFRYSLLKDPQRAVYRDLFHLPCLMLPGIAHRSNAGNRAAVHKKPCQTSLLHIY